MLRQHLTIGFGSNVGVGQAFLLSANSAIATARGPVAQWLELAAHNRLVSGSNPDGPTTIMENELPH